MWFALLLALLQPATIEPNVPVTIHLSAGNGPVDIQYTGSADEIVQITARSAASEAIDVTLEVLLNETRIAFNDDHSQTESELSPLDAAITDLSLPEAGDYIIRVHSFSGAQSGAVEILIASNPTIMPCRQPLQSVPLKPYRTFTCRLELQAGKRVTLTAHDLSGTLDPVLTLADAKGSLLAYSDDHSDGDLGLNVLDARIVAYAVAEDCDCVIDVRDFSGEGGMGELIIEIES